MKLPLPQDDPNPAARAAALADRGSAYAYNRDFMGTLFANKLPAEERYDAPYVAAVVGLNAKLLVNRTGQSTRSWPPRSADETSFSETVLGGALSVVTERLAATTNHLPPERPTDPVGYDDLHAAVQRPLSFGLHGNDDFFAWRQVAGMTPFILRALDAIPAHLPLDAVTYARALGGADRLDAALAEGRLFVCDYAALDGMEAGVTDGFQKHIYAPIAVFARVPDGRLRPVVIQTGQRPSPESPLWTPADGVAWRMAKAVVNSAEMLVNSAVAHLGMCHLTAEVIICVSHRTLAPTHPLLHLLTPHFRYTMATNETARTSILNPGGTQEYLLGGTNEADFALVRRVLGGLRYDAIGARADFAARGVDDVARLPTYPFRDDGVPVADAIHRWVGDYLRVYYADDAAVRADSELRAWAATLAGDGQFGGMPALDSVAALARFVGDLLWRLTGFHAVINYGGWDFASWAPDMPSALFGPAPRPGATEDDWRAMLPPLSVANKMLEQMHTLRSIHLNHLGGYPAGHFDDPRVVEAAGRFSAELDVIAAATEARDAARPWSFPFLRPSLIPNSIHV
jgi:arachidonate 15-lipoxygenase